MGKRRPHRAREGTGEAHFSALYINCRLVCCRLQAGPQARRRRQSAGRGRSLLTPGVCVCVYKP